MSNHIVMLCSLDTKAPEAQFLKACIQELGDTPILLDIGYGQPAKLQADISADEVARAAGSDIDSIHAMHDTGYISQLMMQGAVVRVHELLAESRCDGIIAFGGASNTTLATGIMKSLPVGVPKLMISSAAAIPAYASMYFGSRDITMMHCVVDISGLNDLTRSFLKQGAGGICGMAACSNGPVSPSGDTRLVAVSSFRFAETCSQAVMRELETRGFTPIPFHAQGIGENAMENMIAQGVFVGVVDVVPAGLSEQLLGGNRAAREDRLEAAGRADVPLVVAPSGFDMISCGPIDRKTSGDPLWEHRSLADRQISIPDKFRVEARTTALEVAEIAETVARKLNLSSSKAAVVIPTRGWSSLSASGEDLYNPEIDAVFATTLKQNLRTDVPVLEVDAELNSETFAHQLVEQLLRMLDKQ